MLYISFLLSQRISLKLGRESEGQTAAAHLGGFSHTRLDTEKW